MFLKGFQKIFHSFDWNVSFISYYPQRWICGGSATVCEFPKVYRTGEFSCRWWSFVAAWLEELLPCASSRGFRDVPETLGSGAIAPTTCGHAAICRGQWQHWCALRLQWQIEKNNWTKNGPVNTRYCRAAFFQLWQHGFLPPCKFSQRKRS